MEKVHSLCLRHTIPVSKPGLCYLLHTLVPFQLQPCRVPVFRCELPLENESSIWHVHVHVLFPKTDGWVLLELIGGITLSIFHLHWRFFAGYLVCLQMMVLVFVSSIYGLYCNQYQH